MATLSFSIAATAFDTGLLPEAARQVGTAAFREGVSDFLWAQFEGFGGHATFKVDDETISVVWNPDERRPDPMTVIVERLQRGNQAEGIQLLELLLSSRPEDPQVLYNLGLALSDAGRLERAEQCLRRASGLNPGEASIQAALGVALGRMGRQEEAVAVLRAAVRQDSDNPWARRNLGATLLRTGKPAEAITHFEAAARLLPEDQLAWLGLGDAHRLAGSAKEAERAYRTAIEINPHSDLADRARQSSNRLAQCGFERSRQAVPRQDAVQYCLEALRRLAPMAPEELKSLGLELALAGREGFAVHNPERRYRVKGLEGELSGLAMVCYLYVAMQRVAPGTDIGFDLAAEYEEAKKSFDDAH